MAKFAGKALNFTVNAVAIEGSMSDSTLSVTQETPEVTTFADAGPRRVVGNYDYNIDVKGFPDFASGNSDATLFALVGSSGVATGWDPTGASAGSNDPNYDSTSMVLGSYSISSKVGGAAEMTATLLGNAALSRAVA